MLCRTATLVVCAIDTAIWLAVVIATVMSRSDAATIGLDRAAGILVTGLYAMTAAPAIALTVWRRFPTMALALALAFPLRSRSRSLPRSLRSRNGSR